MRQIVLTLTFILLFAVSSSHAQRRYKDCRETRSSIGISAKISTNGVGGDFYWQVRPRFVVRAGYETMRFNYNYEINEKKISLDTKFKFQTGAATLTAGYQFLGWMFVTGGVGTLFLEPKAHGVPSKGIEYGDIILSPETVGDLSVRIKPQTKVSPYMALGFGKMVPKRRGVSFGVELGAYYMGAPKLEVNATGMLAPSMDPEHIAMLEDQVDQFKFYPVIKFNLSVKLFTFNKR